VVRRNKLGIGRGTTYTTKQGAEKTSAWRQATLKTVGQGKKPDDRLKEGDATKKLKPWLPPCIGAPATSGGTQGRQN